MTLKGADSIENKRIQHYIKVHRLMPQHSKLVSQQEYLFLYNPFTSLRRIHSINFKNKQAAITCLSIISVLHVPCGQQINIAKQVKITHIAPK